MMELAGCELLVKCEDGVRILRLSRGSQQRTTRLRLGVAARRASPSGVDAALTMTGKRRVSAVGRHRVAGRGRVGAQGTQGKALTA